MKWNIDLSVEDDDMDRQHQLLFGYVNEFLDACKEKRDVLYLIQILGKIQDYTLYHFSEEEEHMAKHDYPGLELHKTIHVSLIHSLEGFMAKIAEGEKISNELKHFLKQWLVSHIQSTDRDYARYIKLRKKT
jgi:hemerythrin-like metal-binding protein